MGRVSFITTVSHSLWDWFRGLLPEGGVRGGKITLWILGGRLDPRPGTVLRY
jgi:hypothetical protein